jgi:hypothetical protein
MITNLKQQSMSESPISPMPTGSHLQSPIVEHAPASTVPTPHSETVPFPSFDSPTSALDEAASEQEAQPIRGNTTASVAEEGGDDRHQHAFKAARLPHFDDKPA